MTLILAFVGVGGVIGGCVRPPVVAAHPRPAYRLEPPPPPLESSNQPARPALPLPVPPEPVSAAAAGCANPGSGALTDARKQQIFKEFSQFESVKQGGAKADAGTPPPAGASPAPPCGAVQ